jgi:tight adherence protein C
VTRHLPLVLGLAWAGLVIAVGWVRRPRPHRGAELAPAIDERTPARLPSQLVGGPLLRLLGRSPDDPSAVVAGRAVLVGGGLGVINPLLGVVGAAAVLAWGRVAASRDRRRQAGAVSDQLPEVVDLLVLAAGSGLNVALSVEAVGRFSNGTVGRAFAEVARDQRRGRLLSDALAELPAELGPPVRGLSAALVDADRYGTPLLPVLETLAAEVRQQRRRRAEDRARQAPVRLIFPLVLCALPAFGLLTVVPLLLATLRSFHT